ncbi:hypothetical protein L1987_81054 [Smallanthus sonchifolius]|uniref:Uncharacterized protein n=1 Tax=Smallanthus sonchifolius TaxID=185202 RepID=A0ACB8YNN6_9ASTR|nr:hypothetical protein L1987_81054 [Smallanthus sonchifolius]
MATKLTETEIKKQKCRKHIANFLSALNFHDNDPETTIKTMRRKLQEIEQKQSAAAVVLKKPPTIRKIIIKFGGSKTSTVEEQRRLPPIVLHKRPHSETLVSGNDDDIEKDSKTLICKRQKNINNNVDSANVMDFITSMGGSEAELVIEKRLTSSDVTSNHGRLLMPALKVKNPGFLSVDEKIKLGNREDISVWVFDPEKSRSTLNLTKWRMSNEYYVLKTNWNDVVKANGLKEGMVIRVLSFRLHDQKLCFALVRVA